MIELWNDIVLQGDAFPQEELLNEKTGKKFFKSQFYSAVALADNKICGLYILHPNNVGRCNHIANASYAVNINYRGNHIGEKLVLDSLNQAKNLKFRILQFNAVVENNIPARKLYEKLGFKQLGVIPKGFKMNDGSYANICPYYIEL